MARDLKRIRPLERRCQGKKMAQSSSDRDEADVQMRAKIWEGGALPDVLLTQQVKTFQVYAIYAPPYIRLVIGHTASDLNHALKGISGIAGQWNRSFWPPGR